MTAYQFSPFAIPAFAAATLVVLFAILVVATRFSRTSVAMLGLSLAAAGWQVSCALMYLAGDARVASMWARAGCAFAVFMAPAMYQIVVSILPASSHRRFIAG